MTQAQALAVMLTRENVFLTGAPGAGKTYTLNMFIEECNSIGRRVAVTASTGIAASHIGGTTIHSWSGLGIMDELTKDDVRRMKNNSRVVKRFKQTDVLVIDEISMLHGFRLDMLDTLAREFRGSPVPFGGLQVILVGDLFQLPPVTRGSSVFDFAHLSKSWAAADLHVCYITEQHRQEQADGLLELLDAMRCGTILPAHRKLLQSRAAIPADPEAVTRLYSHNVDVDTINQQHLDALPGKVKRYQMTDSGNEWMVKALQRNILAPQTLELKVGAEVMFVANNFSEGFVNGSRGKVVKFNKAGDPVVKMLSGRKLAVERHSWKTKEGDVVLAEVEQVPLRLAWAITIHKSQGMSLDAAEIDLTKAFTPGMGYVALSRVRSLDGLYLKGVNDMALTMHEGIYDFDLLLRKQSEGLV